MYSYDDGWEACVHLFYFIFNISEVSVYLLHHSSIFFKNLERPVLSGSMSLVYFWVYIFLKEAATVTIFR